MAALRTFALGLDAALSGLRLALAGEPPGLIVFIFHTLEADGAGRTVPPFAPFQRLSHSTLTELIRILRAQGVRIVGPDEVERGLEPGARHAWLTFDDGYANNLPLADIAGREGVPFTVFVSTGPVETGEAYWWDALWRASVERGVSPAVFARRCEALKALPPAAIRARLVAEYGAAILRPAGDGDRPMTVPELAAFAARPGISIGNHTRSHAILPVLPPAERRVELARAQDDLAGWLGAAPRTLAYPNGGHDAATLSIAAGCGIALAVTTVPGRVRDPAAAPLALPRVALAENAPLPLRAQLARARGGSLLKALGRRAGAFRAR